MVTVLITGGTSGIGAEFARAYARRGYDLVIVARDEARLASSAEEFVALGAVGVEVIVADLADRSDVDRVAERIEDAGRPIDILVNNAGFGMHISLLSRDLAAFDRGFDVMQRAVLVLAGAAGRAMKQRGSGRIINIASTAGFVTMGVYSAIKAWVSIYSEGLSNELRGSGVTVTALCPGWVRTEFHQRAGIRASSIPDVLWMDAAATVAIGIRASERGRVVVVPSARYSFLMFLLKHAPRVTVRWVSRKLSSSRSDSAVHSEAGVH